MSDPIDGRAGNGRRRRRRERMLVLEGLERRDVPSGAGKGGSGAAYEALVSRELAAYGASSSQVHIDSPNGLQGTKANGSFLNPAVIRQAADVLYGSNPPTQREIHRETFTARWVGTYTIGSPRFSDRADTIHLYGTDGGSNQFLIGKFNMSLFPPSDPGAAGTVGNPYAGQVTGIAALIPENYLQSGSELVLDLNGTPAAGSNPMALPTQLTWTYDNNTSAGAYSAPQDFTQGAGIVDITYHPDAHPEKGTAGSGTVVVTFQGLINVNEITSAVSKFIS